MYWLDDLSTPSRDRARATLAVHREAGHVAWGATAGRLPSASCSPTSSSMPCPFIVSASRAARSTRHMSFGMRSTIRFAERWDAPSTPDLARFLADGGVTLAEGQIAEISLAALDWIEDVARRLEQGYVIVDRLRRYRGCALPARPVPRGLADVLLPAHGEPRAVSACRRAGYDGARRFLRAWSGRARGRTSRRWG